MKKLLTTAVLIGLLGHQTGATAAPPFESLRATLNGHLYLCKLAMKLELARAEADRANVAIPDESSATKVESSASCVKEKRTLGRAEFAKYAKMIKKKAALDALKSAQVAYLAAMDGIQPQSGERRGAYEQRQSLLETKLDEAWAKFEVES